MSKINWLEGDDDIGEGHIAARREVDEERILRDAGQLGAVGGLLPEVEALFRDDARLSFVGKLKARPVVGVAMDVMEEVDLGSNFERVGDLLDERAKVLAATLPERIFRLDGSDEQWEAFMEVVGNVGVPNSLSLYEQAGLMVAARPELALVPGMVDFVMGQVRQHLLKQVGGFVKIFPTGDAGVMIGELEEESARSGIGYEANLVTESARTSVEARLNISWYKKALIAGAQRIAIKPTALVAFSDSAISGPVMEGRLTTALAEIFAEARPGSIVTVDSERSDIVEVVRKAVVAAAARHPQVHVQMAIQAYLADSETLLLDPLLEASKERVQGGGAPLGARLVNGANGAGEANLASANFWEGTPLVGSRAEAHGNYMRLRDKMIEPIKKGEFSLTVGTMNLLTLIETLQALAKAHVFTSKGGGFVDFAMLKGMTGESVFPELIARYKLNVHIYTAITWRSQILELFKYYLRRVDELASQIKETNSGQQVANYLGILAKYGVDSPEWITTQVRDGLFSALAAREKMKDPLQPKIKGYRGTNEPTNYPSSLAEYKPMPNIAPGSKEDSAWIDALLSKLDSLTSEQAVDLRIDIPGLAPRPLDDPRKVLEVYGPAKKDLLLGRVELADRNDIRAIFDLLDSDPAGWAGVEVEFRAEMVRKAVFAFQKNREKLVGSLIMNAGKSILEADGEVNEAMDFVNLGYVQLQELLKRSNLEFGNGRPGVAAVICPKNFPQAIPAAHIMALLIGGHRVVVKPSGGEKEETILATYEMVKCFWDAGIPKDVLAFVPCTNRDAAYLTKKAKKIGFTGSTAVAQAIYQSNYEAELIAETGGRNVILLDDSSDLKAAATEILRSATGHAGQKCSKPALVIATATVNFEELCAHLLGQMKELLIGSSLVRNVDVNPLTREYPPEHPFYQKVMNCRPGEEWLMGAKPAKMGDPGIRVIEDPEDFDFQTLDEIFAPIITICQLKEGGVTEAIDLISKLKGTLTGALLSQNRANIEEALTNWKTGNLYVGRGSTGALAHYGFGDGVGDSHLGMHGAKTGTPEWLVANMNVRGVSAPKYDKEAIPGYSEGADTTRVIELLQHLESLSYLPKELKSVCDAALSYFYEAATYFNQKRPAPYKTHGQHDWIESHPVGKVLFRMSRLDDRYDLLRQIFATAAAGNILEVSLHGIQRLMFTQLNSELGMKDFENYFPHVTYDFQTDGEFPSTISHTDAAYIATSGHSQPYEDVFLEAANRNLYVHRRPMTGDGRVDLIPQFRQQSYCFVYHTAGDTSYEDFLAKQK